MGLAYEKEKKEPAPWSAFWPRHTFYGWQGLEHTGSTAYADILAPYAGW
ncbi:MAG TPA: hypothetical protein VGJ80_13395 [Gemmatimonadales bacterium]